MGVRDVQRDGDGVAILTTPQAIALAEYHRHDPSGESTPAMRSPLGGDLDAHIAMYEEDDRPIIEALAAWVLRWAPVVASVEAQEDARRTLYFWPANAWTPEIGETLSRTLSAKREATEAAVRAARVGGAT